MLRRVLAVVVDFFVVYAVWAAVGIFAAGRDHPEFSSARILLYLAAVDLPLTAFFGSPPVERPPGSESCASPMGTPLASPGPGCASPS
jgi:hypothetical protein